MSVHIDIIGPVTDSELDAMVSSDEFNRPFDEYIAACYKKHTEGLTDSELAEVDTWWAGHVPQGYWDNVSRPAYESILTLVSCGLG